MMSSGAPTREVWGFDSFEGLPPAGEHDPERAAEWEGTLKASEAKVREAFARFAHPERLHLVKGWFEDTFPKTEPQIGQVAMLHADGDWYDSVLLTLETFYAKVSPGGFVVIDDYRAWEGAKIATTSTERRTHRRTDGRGRQHRRVLAETALTAAPCGSSSACTTGWTRTPARPA